MTGDAPPPLSEWLSRLKADHPAWRVGRIPPTDEVGWLAQKFAGDEVVTIRAATMSELEEKLAGEHD